MEIQFKPVEFPEPITRGWDYPLVWDVEFDPDMTTSEMRAILAKEDWKPMSLGYGLENNSLRSVLGPPFKSKELTRVHEAFTHRFFKDQVLETIKSIPYFSNLWPTGRLAEITEITAFWGRDLPGFKISPHLDNRLQICTGMIFFNEENDPASGTKFTRTNGGEVIKTGNCGFGQGWLLVHDYHGWHHGMNASAADRFHLTFHLRIRA